MYGPTRHLQDRPVAHTTINGKFYVDTAFLNSLGGIPGVSLEHMGFGEFYASTPHGTVDFDRMRGKDFPGQSGRSHQAYDREGYGTKATEWLIDQVESRGKSVRVASGGDGLRSRLIRLAAAKPELRADILPLLREDADPASVDQNKPESYYGLPPRGVQAGYLRRDPNRASFVVTNSIRGPVVVNLTQGINKSYVYDGTPDGLADSLNEAATAALRFQSMDVLDGPEINVVRAPRVPPQLANTVVESNPGPTRPVYISLQGGSAGLRWVIMSGAGSSRRA